MKSTAYVLATRSTHKLAEIQALLHDAVRIITLDDAGVDVTPDEDNIEVFDTFRENAIAKALYFMQKTGLPTIADDSGIMIDALDGLPGVRSRRFSGRTDLDGNALDHANNQLAVEKLRNTNADERGAQYMCVAALARPDHHIVTCIGSCTGSFLLEPRGTGGFGYDPHFLSRDVGRTFAELSNAEKQRVSHRARAFRALTPHLI
jgi:XTP/dITP diphosphohydrolase